MEMVYEKVKLFRKQMEILIPEGFKDKIGRAHV